MEAALTCRTQACRCKLLKCVSGGWHEWTIWQAFVLAYLTLCPSEPSFVSLSLSFSMAEAPQLPFRNYYASPACSRARPQAQQCCVLRSRATPVANLPDSSRFLQVWAYVASIWECGGVAYSDEFKRRHPTLFRQLHRLQA